MAIAVRWPGPVHEGHGVMQPIIDTDADAEQRTALLSILTGKETDPMATFWSIYAAMCDTIYDPIYTVISIDLDMDARAHPLIAGTYADACNHLTRIRTGTAGTRRIASSELPASTEGY